MTRPNYTLEDMREDLTRLINYNYADESHDYYRCGFTDGDPMDNQDHIFGAIERLGSWLGEG